MKNEAIFQASDYPTKSVPKFNTWFWTSELGDVHMTDEEYQEFVR